MPSTIDSSNLNRSSMQRGERGLDAHGLTFGDEALKHVSEMRMACARVNVLPPVSFEETGFDDPRFRRAECAAAVGLEIARVGGGAPLQQAIDRNDELDEFIDSLVAIVVRHGDVVTDPFQLIECYGARWNRFGVACYSRRDDEVRRAPDEKYVVLSSARRNGQPDGEASRVRTPM